MTGVLTCALPILARVFVLRRLLSDRGAVRAALFQNRGQPVHRARDALAARARLSADAGSVDVMSYAEVIGDPIKHSKSQLIHSFWLDALGLDASYRATHVTPAGLAGFRSEEHTSELQSLMRNSYAVFCLTKKK